MEVYLAHEISRSALVEFIFNLVGKERAQFVKMRGGIDGHAQDASPDCRNSRMRRYVWAYDLEP
jgi:hypothetical protein